MNKRNKRRARYYRDKPPADLEVGLQDNSPESIQQAFDVLAEAEKSGVTTIVKTYKSSHPDGANFHHYNDIRTERRDGPDHNVASMLLNAAKAKTPPLMLDDRPIIDQLHEATFTHPLGMYAIGDDYALRMLLRKAHCFTLDEATSSMVADFSMATTVDLEAARRLAIPPFDVTWIELNNHARLKRMFELKAPLGTYDPKEPPTSRIGWLIHPATELGGWYATYVSVIDVGVWIAPLSYWWHSGSPNPKGMVPTDKVAKLIEWLLFGTAGNVFGEDAHMHASNLHVPIQVLDVGDTKDIMAEMAGELRHIWGFLIALAAGQNGVKLTSQSNPTRAPPIMKNGKPLLPLEHKVLHLHLRKAPQKLISQAITHHHNRQHDVRAHWRTLKSGKRVPIKSHQRGDVKLGRIEKTYHVER